MSWVRNGEATTRKSKPMPAWNSASKHELNVAEFSQLPRTLMMKCSAAEVF